MKKAKTVKTRKTVKAKAMKTRTAKVAFYKAPLNYVSESFSTLASYFK